MRLTAKFPLMSWTGAFMLPYLGNIKHGSCPKSWRAIARELVTSANPPTLAKGKASEAINRIFIMEIRL